MATKRTYDWNGHTDLPISFANLPDVQMAGTVRMLMRNDLGHEAVVCGARDRIMCLVKEKALLEARVAELQAALKSPPSQTVLGVIEQTRSLVSEAAMTGFNCHDGDWAERLFLNQAALSAVLKTPVSDAGTIPKGWKLVPEQPTDQMRDALMYVRQEYGSTLRDNADAIYEAMMENAPEPPVTERADG